LNIIILGAGHTGASVARSLSNEGNNVVVIDTNASHLRQLQESSDIATVVGRGTFPETLEQANIQEADLLISVMHQDEDNMVACHIAWILFKTPRIIARIRDAHYLAHPELFTKNNIPIDTLISPESLVTEYIQHIIEYPGTQQLHSFAQGVVKLVSIDIKENSSADKRSIESLRSLAPQLFCVALFQEKQKVSVERSTIINAGDRLLYLVSEDHLDKSLALFMTDQQHYKRIILAGGGHIGKRLAKALQGKFNLKIIEQDSQRANDLAENLEKVMVLCGDATNPTLLKEEGIADSDLFCALTSSDEVNILSSMLTKKLGVKRTLCLVNKVTYADMIPSDAIDTVFSPERITSASILRYVRGGGIVNVCPIHSTALEVLEIILEGTSETSRIIGLTPAKIELPEDISISAIIRDNQLFRPSDEIMLQARDRILLLTPQNLIAHIENHFQIAE